MKNCFLFGHSDAPEEIRQKIEAAVERLYRMQDVRLFYVGGYGAFDREQKGLGMLHHYSSAVRFLSRSSALCVVSSPCGVDTSCF